MRSGPGGTLSFTAKKPATEEIRHQELLQKFDALSKSLRVAQDAARRLRSSQTKEGMRRDG